jgi:putative colanic acid biosynthesis acetyltransferase WcaF
MTPPMDLKRYDNSWYSPGRSPLWRALWMFVGQPLFRCTFLPSSALRCSLLRGFGAQVGRGVVIHSEVVVKYPWHLRIGEDTWIGERVWIDSLVDVCIGSNVCVSQAAYLCTGNHDWSDPAFGLKLGPIEIMDGAWVGARSTLLPGSTLEIGAVVTAGSVIGGTVPTNEIFGGNPAVYLRKRRVRAAAVCPTPENVERQTA